MSAHLSAMQPAPTRSSSLHLRAAVMIAVGLFAAALLRAQTVSIPGLFTTGVNNANAIMTNNAVDAHYVVSNIPASAPSNNAGNSRVINTSALPGAWTGNTPAARWITTPGRSTGTGSGGENPSRVNGTFDYTLTFTLPAGGILSTVNITGVGASDDSTEIFVNGTLVSGQSTASYTTTQAFTLNSSNASFVSGTNTITFRVNNSGGGPTGLLITSLSGTVDIPEVGTWLPVLGAILLYGVVLWRRRSPAFTAPSPR